MKKTIIALLLLAATIYAAGEFHIWQEGQMISVTTNGEGDSTMADGIIGVGPSYGYSSLQAEVILENANPTYAGLGNADSGWIWLYTSHQTGDRVNLDSVVANSLPCTLSTVIHSNVGDTAIRDFLEIGWQIYDSLGDSAFTATYPIKYKVKLK